MAIVAARPDAPSSPHASCLKHLMEEFELEDEAFNVRGPSKSRRKRESSALQDLGEELTALPAEQLKRLELPQDLFEAVRLAQSITAHGGLQRQRKFIGKLLRGLDPEPIRARLAGLRGASAEKVRLLHHCEEWRDRMLEEGDAPINEFVGEHPEAERGKLRQLVRDARREHEAERPPRSARLLFRYLREIVLAGDVPEPGELDLD